MNILKLSTIATTAAMALFAATVSAQQPKFEELDRDGDGYISAKEAMVMPCLAENFARIDRESEEGLNASEYATALQQYCEPDEDDWPEL